MGGLTRPKPPGSVALRPCSRGLFDLFARDDHAVLAKPGVRGGQHFGGILLGLLGLFVAFASDLGHRKVPCLPGGGCRQRLTGVSARHQGRTACAGTEPVGERWLPGGGNARVSGGGPVARENSPVDCFQPRTPEHACEGWGLVGWGQRPAR